MAEAETHTPSIQVDNVTEGKINVEISSCGLTFETVVDRTQTLKSLKTSNILNVWEGTNVDDLHFLLCETFTVLDDMSVIGNIQANEPLKFQFIHIPAKAISPKSTPKGVHRMSDQDVYNNSKAKKKLAEERISEPILIVEFDKDSPFFRDAVQTAEKKLSWLDKHLRGIVKMGKEFGIATEKFSAKGRQLGEALKQTLVDVEGEHASDILSLTMQTEILGNIFEQTSHSLEQLSMTLQHTLFRSFEEFTQKHLADCFNSEKVLNKTHAEYEKALTKMLRFSIAENQSGFFSRKKVDLEKNQNLFNGLTDTANSKMKNYEEQRFDHCVTLNQCLNEHRMDLLESIVAAFRALETFYHVGYDQTLSLSYKFRDIQNSISDRRRINKEYSQKLTVNKKLHLKELDAQIEQDRAFRAGEKNPITEEMYDVNCHAGYLWKKSTSVRQDWKRRYFELRNGELHYYKDESLEPSYVVNCVFASCQKDEEQPNEYCFKIISTFRREYQLQSESFYEYKLWTSILQEQVKRQLRESSMSAPVKGRERQRTPSFVKRKKFKYDARATVLKVNNICADCGAKDPDWCVINIGVVICIACSGVHRSLGTHISKVRSLTLDDINLVTLKVLMGLGNEVINEIYEHTQVEDYPKPGPDASREEREHYIKGKYSYRLFLNANLKKPDDDQENEALYECAKADDLEGMISHLAFGAKWDWKNPNESDRTSLHIAAACGQSRAADFLINNGADLGVEDSAGDTPPALAVKSENEELISLFEMNKRA